MSQTVEISVDSRSAVRVLVVDADDETRSHYRESLRVAGCDVIDAVDGRDALVKALSVRPTLVITETRLPTFDGYAPAHFQLGLVLRRLGQPEASRAAFARAQQLNPSLVPPPYSP